VFLKWRGAFYITKYFGVCQGILSPFYSRQSHSKYDYNGHKPLLTNNLSWIVINSFLKNIATNYKL